MSQEETAGAGGRLGDGWRTAGGRLGTGWGLAGDWVHLLSIVKLSFVL